MCALTSKNLVSLSSGPASDQTRLRHFDKLLACQIESELNDAITSQLQSIELKAFDKLRTCQITQFLHLTSLELVKSHILCFDKLKACQSNKFYEIASSQLLRTITTLNTMRCQSSSHTDSGVQSLLIGICLDFKLNVFLHVRQGSRGGIFH